MGAACGLAALACCPDTLADALTPLLPSARPAGTFTPRRQQMEAEVKELSAKVAALQEDNTELHRWVRTSGAHACWRH